MTRIHSFLALLFLALPLAAQTATIHGVVKDGAANQVLGGASVQALAAVGGIMNTTTASDGSYSFSVQPGRWYVRAAEAGGSHRAEYYADHACGGSSNVACILSFADPIDVAAGESRTIDLSLPGAIPFGTFNIAPIRDAQGGGTLTATTQFLDPQTHTLLYSTQIPAQTALTAVNLPPHDYLVMTAMNSRGILHGLADGGTCWEPCPWIKTPVHTVQQGSSFELHLVQPRMTITDVTPDHGLAAGGTPVKIRGFFGAYDIPTTVTFAGARADVDQEDNCVLDVATPPGAGNADVTIQSHLPYLATQKGAFHYVDGGASFLALTTPRSPILLAQTAVVTVEISPVRATPTTVALISSDHSLLSVPASVAIPAGASRATFVANGIGYGGGRITASADGAQSSSLVVQVQAPAMRLILPTAYTGSTDGTGTLAIEPAQPNDTAYYVTDVNRFVGTVVTIPAHQTSATFPLHDFYSLGHFPRLQVIYPPAFGGKVATSATMNGQAFDVTADSDHYIVAAGSAVQGRLQLSGGEIDSAYAVSLFPTSKGLTITPQPVFIDVGKTTASFTIEGKIPGTYTVKVWDGLSTFKVDVIPAATPRTHRRATAH